MAKASEAYAAFAKDSYSWKFIEQPALDRALPASVYNEDTTILDIGSGSGRVIDYHLQRGANEANITGVEPDVTSVKLSRERFPSAELIEQKIQDINLDDGAYDIVTAQLSLRYLSNDELVIVMKHIHTALKVGGLFFILDAHPARYGVSDGFTQYFDEGVRQVDTPWGGSEDYYYRTLSTWVNTVANSGLTIQSVDECPITGDDSRVNSEDFARYSISPARFAILATKVKYGN